MASLVKKPQITSGPPITPTFAWYDASNLASIAASGGLVTQLNDLSGQGNHLTAAGGARPQTGVDTINGLNVLKFSAGNGLSVAAAPASNPSTYFIVVKLSAVLTGNVLIVSANGSNLFAGNALFQTVAIWGAYNGSGIGGGTSDLAAHVLDAIFANGSGAALELDGASLATGSTGGNGPASATKVGGDAGVAFTGDVGELLIYTGAMSAPNRALVQAYLKAKWGTP